MKIMIAIQHPAWAHQFRYIIKTLIARGDEVLILAVDKDRDLELLNAFGLPYVKMADSTGKNIVEKGMLFLKLCVTYSICAKRFKPDILIGRASPMMAVAARYVKRPHLVYEDTEVSKFSLRICKYLSAEIITPHSFLTNLGSKQKRVDTFKELFYLHPEVFSPSRELLRRFDFNPDEAYVIVRFISWNASHDVGLKGLSEREKLGFVTRLGKLCKVYVSSEAPMSEELQPYALNLPYETIHHALAFANLCISEGASMASESAVLGVHAFYINDIVSGTTKELCERYGLMYNFQRAADKYDHALEKASELLGMENLREIGQAKRDIMLTEKVNMNSLYLSEIDRLC